MRSCGTILGHAPFYNAEAVSNVLACAIMLVLRGDK